MIIPTFFRIFGVRAVLIDQQISLHNNPADSSVYVNNPKAFTICECPTVMSRYLETNLPRGSTTSKSRSHTPFKCYPLSWKTLESFFIVIIYLPEVCRLNLTSKRGH